MPLAPQTRLGPYEILVPLGAGGMGEVYKARDTRLDRVVAIKVLPEHLSAAPDLRLRFEREARAVSSLSHPNICTLYDVGHQEGIDFLVMEHLEGETLAQRLERGPMPTHEVLRVASEIADALDKAHRQGMIHRDLKPGNVMLTKTGAKLLDFGLARATAATGPTPDALSRTPTRTTPLTAAGTIVGTYQYMAPEQLEGGEADARSDIWAFGATVYEMATGRRAFEGASQASLIASILKENPRPISELQPLTPPGLDRLVARCLAKEPDDRWQSARDLAHELRWIAGAGSQAGVPAPVAARRRVQDRALKIVTVVSTLLWIAFASAYLLRRPPERPVVRFEIRPPTTVQFQDAPRVSPDGKNLAYTATDSTGASRVWIRPLAGTSAAPLAGTEGVRFRPFWSPDSRSLAFFAAGKLKKIQVGGGPATTICDAPNGADGSWSRRGIILYDGGDQDPIRRVPATGGVPTIAVPADSAKGMTVGWPCFLPDGKHFLYLTLGTDQRLMLGTLGSSKSRDLGVIESRVEFVPPAFVLFTRGGTLVAQRLDVGRGRLAGDPVPIAEAVRTSPSGGADFSSSDNGTLAYSSGASQNNRFLIVDRTGKELGVVPLRELTNALNPALSPDGRRLAFRSQDPQTRTRDLWVTDLARGVVSRLTFEPRNENYPVWSLDGQRIAYYSDNPGSQGILARNAAGAGGIETLLKSTNELVLADWSRDGKYIVYTLQVPGRNPEIWYVPLEGDRKPVSFVAGPFDCAQPALSPDGRWLAYASQESGRPEIYVQPFPGGGGKWQVSSEGGADPRWRADGKELFFMSAEQRMMSVTIHASSSLEVDQPTPLFQQPVVLPGTLLRSHYVISSDAQRFILAAPSAAGTVGGTQVVLNWTAEVQPK